MSLRAALAPTAFGVVGAVFDDAGRVVLVRHSYTPGWRLPGGGIDRGEAPEAAVRRELGEEIGLAGGSVSLFGLYVRPAGWATNLVGVYRVAGATIDFRPSLEIREICLADPRSPPDGCTEPTRRRLLELAGVVPPRPSW